MFISKKRLLNLKGYPAYVSVVILRREKIFSVPENAKLFLDVLQQQRQRYGIAIHEYVIMPDHYHAILTPPQKYTVSDTLHHIHGIYAMLYNRKVGRNGKLFQPHFWNHLIMHNADYEAKAKYIHMNPVRAKLVRNPVDYPWSSARERYTGTKGYLELDDWV